MSCFCLFSSKAENTYELLLMYYRCRESPNSPMVAAAAPGFAYAKMTMVGLHVRMSCFAPLQNPFIWTNLIAIAISTSGLRQWLDPDLPSSIPALAWVEGSLRWLAATCIPVQLFAAGVWVHGKSILNRSIIKQVGWDCEQRQGTRR